MATEFAYHWLSTYSGEVVEGFSDLVKEVKAGLKIYKDEWGILDKLKYIFCWRYNKMGFC